MILCIRRRLQLEQAPGLRTNLFWQLTRGLKLSEKLPWKPLRTRLLREAKQWMLGAMGAPTGCAAIYRVDDEFDFCVDGEGARAGRSLTFRESMNLPD